MVTAILDRVGALRTAERRAGGGGDKARAEDDTIRFEKASPQIGKVEGVKWAARGEADGLELRGGQRGGGKRKSEFRHGSGAPARQFQGEGVGGEKDLPGADFLPVDTATEVAADAQAQRVREVQRTNLGVLDDLGAGVFCGAREASEHFARVNCAAGHAADDFQLAGVAPRNRRMLSDRVGTFGRRSRAAKLPDARKCQPRVNAECAESFFVAGEHVAESGKLAGRGFRERHAASAAAGAVTERSGLQHKDGTPGSKPAQPRRSGKSREAAANNGEIHMIRQCAWGGTEINGPGRRTPGMNFAAHGISLMPRELGGWREFPRLHNNTDFRNGHAN